MFGKLLLGAKSAVLDAEVCLKFFRAVFVAVFAWSFSMLSETLFLRVSDGDEGLLFSGGVDGGVCLD